MTPQEIYMEIQKLSAYVEKNMIAKMSEDDNIYFDVVIFSSLLHMRMIMTLMEKYK